VKVFARTRQENYEEGKLSIFLDGCNFAKHTHNQESNASDDGEGKKIHAIITIDGKYTYFKNNGNDPEEQNDCRNDSNNEPVVFFFCGFWFSKTTTKEKERRRKGTT
jgi:hypothetical protein